MKVHNFFGRPGEYGVLIYRVKTIKDDRANIIISGTIWPTRSTSSMWRTSMPSVLITVITTGTKQQSSRCLTIHLETL